MNETITILGREYVLEVKQGSATLYEDINLSVHRLVIFDKPGWYSVTIYGPGYTYTSSNCNTVAEALKNIEARIKATFEHFNV